MAMTIQRETYVQQIVTIQQSYALCRHIAPHTVPHFCRHGSGSGLAKFNGMRKEGAATLCDVLPSLRNPLNTSRRQTLDTRAASRSKDLLATRKSPPCRHPPSTLGPVPFRKPTRTLPVVRQCGPAHNFAISQWRRSLPQVGRADTTGVALACNKNVPSSHFHMICMHKLSPRSRPHSPHLRRRWLSLPLPTYSLRIQRRRATSDGPDQRLLEWLRGLLWRPRPNKHDTFLAAGSGSNPSRVTNDWHSRACTV